MLQVTFDGIIAWAYEKIESGFKITGYILKRLLLMRFIERTTAGATRHLFADIAKVGGVAVLTDE